MQFYLSYRQKIKFKITKALNQTKSFIELIYFLSLKSVRQLDRMKLEQKWIKSMSFYLFTRFKKKTNRKTDIHYSDKIKQGVLFPVEVKLSKSDIDFAYKCCVWRQRMEAKLLWPCLHFRDKPVIDHMLTSMKADTMPESRPMLSTQQWTTIFSLSSATIYCCELFFINLLGLWIAFLLIYSWRKIFTLFGCF